jgi:hypothetical protein
MQAQPVAINERRAVAIPTSTPVIDPVAVASVERACGAKPPNRALDETRKARRKIGVELARFDAMGQALDDFGATIRTVAARPVKTIRDPQAGTNRRPRVTSKASLLLRPAFAGLGERHDVLQTHYPSIAGSCNDPHRPGVTVPGLVMR